MRTIQDMIEQKQWNRADNYCGEDYSNYIRVVGQCRDSDLLEQSNFQTALEMLGGEQDNKVIVVRSSHWAVGWVECILVSKKSKKHLKTALDIHNKLESYPVLDESDYYERESDKINSCHDYYERESDKINSCHDYYAGDFAKVVCKFLGIDLIENKAMEELTFDIYRLECGYCGESDAFVNDASIKRYISSCESLPKNKFYKMLKNKVVQ